MSESKSNGARRVSALRALPRDIEPPAALWSRLEKQLTASAPAARSRGLGLRPRTLAAAAVIAALAVGVLIGRVLLPAAGPSRAGLAAHLSHSSSAAVQVAYVSDPRYLREREELLRSLQAQLSALPPDTRNKVMASLATIHQSMQDLQAALGRDPSNALLQELLVNTYQDEMRVLTTVHEAGAAGEEL